MTQVIRHGGESHFVRPDGVFRTSVLQPIVGYQPDADVQMVTQAFTQGPPYGTVLSGPFATGWMQRLGLRIKAMFAKSNASAFQNVGMQGVPQYGAGPAPVAGQQIAPQLASQMQMLMRLTPDAGSVVAQAGHTLARRRINAYYYAG